MLVHSYCPADPRVRREAEGLVAAGYRVDVLCLRDRGQRWQERVAGVRYLRLPLRRRRGGLLRYAFEYCMICGVGSLAVGALYGAQRYRLVQVHNMPDFLVFATLVPWFAGVPVLLDLHDPVPELYESKFGLGRDSLLIRLLTRIEGASVAFADAVLAATGAFRRRLLERGRPADRIRVVLNSPDPGLFEAAPPRPEAVGEARLLFHGTVTRRSGVDLAVLAAERVRKGGLAVRFTILGDGDYLPVIREMVAQEGRREWVEVRGPVPLEDIPAEVAGCDLGIVPNRGGAFSDLALPTRLFEYLGTGRPVAVSRSPAIQDLFGEEDLLFFDPGSLEDMVRVVGNALGDANLRQHMVERGGKIYEAHSWEKECAGYLDVVRRLTGSREEAGRRES
jgi:glycosyltransferase involved in cell wall biosynthesis